MPSVANQSERSHRLDEPEALDEFLNSSPEGFATLSSSAMPEATSAVHRSKLRKTLPQRKIDVKVELPVGSVSAFTLIRTDTTLDHSQKAEKV